GGANLPQARRDAGHETLADGLLLGGAVGTAAQDEGLTTGVVRAALDLQPFPQRLPAAVPHGAGEPLEAAARRADDVPRTALLHTPLKPASPPTPRSKSQMRPCRP